MRRFLLGVACFAMGLVTLPLLAIGARLVSAHQSLSMVSVAADRADYVQTEEVAAISATEIDLSVEQSDCVAVPATHLAHEQFAEAQVGIAQPEEAPFVEQNDRSLIGSVAEPVAELGAPVKPQIILPATPEMLAKGEPGDEVEADKLIELRETLKRTVESKSALLNAEALQAEIAMHQRHQADLQALLELQHLQKSLEELGDKYPDSDAGRRAKDVLQMLKNRGPVPIYHPVPAESYTPGASYVPTPGVVPTPVEEQFIEPRAPNFTRPTKSGVPQKKGQPIRTNSLPTY